MNFKKIVFYIGLTFLIAACGGGNGSSTDKGDNKKEPDLVIDEVNPYKRDAAAIMKGKQIFKKKCSQCHGSDAEGGPETPDLTDGKSVYGTSDRERFKTLYYGTDNGMPTWKGDLGSKGIWEVLAYLHSLRKTVSISIDLVK